MAITAKASEKKQFPVPSRGLQQAVLVDVTGPELEQTPWGAKEKIRLVFELAEKHPEFNGPFRVRKKYTLSLYEGSNLSADLESWFGKAIPKSTRQAGLDLETLIGRRAGVVIVHKEDEDGIVWGNIQTIIGADPSNQMVASSDYVREKDQAGQGDGANRQAAPARPTAEQVYAPPATTQPPYQPAGTAQPAYQPAGTTGTPPPITYPEDDLPF